MKNKRIPLLRGCIIDSPTGKIIWDKGPMGYKDEELEHVSIPLEKVMKEIEDYGDKSCHICHGEIEKRIFYSRCRPDPNRPQYIKDLEKFYEDKFKKHFSQEEGYDHNSTLMIGDEGE